MKEKINNLLTISKEQEGQRLDKLLAVHFPSFSRTYFQYLIENQAVLLNGSPIKKREKTSLGDQIEVRFLPLPETNLEPQDIPLDILYEDEHLLAVNKPVGMVVHPAPGHPSQTFVNALLFHCKKLPFALDSVRPGIVHRLDKDTSGVLLAAKTIEAHQELVALFAERQIKKQYLAICSGNPGDVTIENSICRNPRKRQEMTVCSEGGKQALTKCRVLAIQGQFSLVELTPHTGRTHQIRVHLKSRNVFLLGDPIYGISSLNNKFNVHRQMLHAAHLSFIHPLTFKQIKVEAPLPNDMRLLINKLKLI